MYAKNTTVFLGDYNAKEEQNEVCCLAGCDSGYMPDCAWKINLVE